MRRIHLLLLSMAALVAISVPRPLAQAPAGPGQATPAAPAPGGGRGQAAADPWAGKKHLLFVADTLTGYQHTYLSHAMALIERMGRESGLYNTLIRTDMQLITKKPLSNGNAKNLNYFDAVFFAGSGEGTLTDDQRADLLSFVHDDGKGFIGSHAAGVGYRLTWPEFGELLGGFQASEYGIVDKDIIVEDPKFPGMDAFPLHFTFKDQFTVVGKPYSRDNVHVIMRLDPAKLDPADRNTQLRPDGDFPIVYSKMYGKGRVFFSSFGHPDETWDDPRVQKMYLEGVKFVLGLTNPDVTPRPMPK
jgi:type 1 glutamine amidotransferase